MKNVLDQKFRYTSSVDTDLKKTFARARRNIVRLEQTESAARADNSRKVLHIAAVRVIPRAV